MLTVGAATATGFFEITMVLVTLSAARYEPLPACDATRMHDPTPVKVMVFPPAPPDVQPDEPSPSVIDTVNPTALVVGFTVMMFVPDG